MRTLAKPGEVWRTLANPQRHIHNLPDIHQSSGEGLVGNEVDMLGNADETLTSLWRPSQSHKISRSTNFTIAERERGGYELEGARKHILAKILRRYSFASLTKGDRPKVRKFKFAESRRKLQIGVRRLTSVTSGAALFSIAGESHNFPFKPQKLLLLKLFISWEKRERDQKTTKDPKVEGSRSQQSLIAPKHNKTSILEISCPSREELSNSDNFLNPRLSGLFGRFLKGGCRRKRGPKKASGNCKEQILLCKNLEDLTSLSKEALCQPLPLNQSRFLGRGCDEALFSEKRGFQ